MRVDASDFLQTYRLSRDGKDFIDDWEAIFVPVALKVRLLTYVDTLQRLRGVAATRLALRRAVLLFGPPGCGKTSLARGLPEIWRRRRHDGTEAGFIHVNTHALFSGVRGQGQENVLAAFSEITEVASSGMPVFVLIDEVETLGSDRTAISMETNPLDALYQVTAFLESLDSCIRDSPNVVFVFTTNIPRSIDRAVRDRVDFSLHIPAPGSEARAQIILDAVRSVRQVKGSSTLEKQLDSREWQQVVTMTEGFSGRSLRHLVVMAMIHADDSDTLTVDHLSAAVREQQAEEDALRGSGGVYVESYLTEHREKDVGRGEGGARRPSR
jgi:AAA+ superfamily predicted ATPase